jgi:hypothetical protein
MTTGCRVGAFVFVVALVSFARPGVARVVVNELYYDHPGTDTGHEFIEIFNAGAFTEDISGATIEFHNGTGTTWALVWRAPAGTTLAADGIFVVGGELVVPRPDAATTYSLQNGPDSIRLVSAGGDVLDVVGYGGLDDPAFVEGLGAGPVPAGKSIGRAFDGVDSNDNSVDFVASAPTPGRHNVARDDAALRLAADTPRRSGRDAAGIERFAVEIANGGLMDIPIGAVTLTVSDSTADGVVPTAAAMNRTDILPGQDERVTVSLSLDCGYHWIDISAHYARDERSDNNTIHALRRVGRIPVLISEVWSSPRDGCPQFVEWMNPGHETADVTGLTIRDERARPVMIDADSLQIGPGEWMAVSADPDRLAACISGARRDRIYGVRGAWPTFNRSGGASADSIVVLDRYGIVVDAVSYPAVPSSSAGRSLERIDLFVHPGPAVWRLCDAATGCSPAAPNGAFIDRAAPAGEITVSPNPFAPSRGDVLRVAASPHTAIARIDGWVYDLEGRRVASLGGTGAFPALLVWDGRRDNGDAVCPGLYLVAVELFAGDGARAGVERVVVGCAAGDSP